MRNDQLICRRSIFVARAAAIVILLGFTATFAHSRDIGLTRVLVLSPRAATKADDTHSVLVVTRARFSNQVWFSGRVLTVRQLRTGSPPNSWECAWIVWHYKDEDHFYYLALKPTGWELGKRDPGYPGGQRFLASGSTKYPIGAWHKFAIRQHRATISVRVNGLHVVTFTDAERPYSSGTLGIYAEDSEVQIDDVTAPFADNFESYGLQTMTQDGSALKRNWITPFLGFGFATIVNRKR